MTTLQDNLLHAPVAIVTTFINAAVQVTSGCQWDGAKVLFCEARWGSKPDREELKGSF